MTELQQEQRRLAQEFYRQDPSLDARDIRMKFLMETEAGDPMLDEIEAWIAEAPAESEEAGLPEGSVMVNGAVYTRHAASGIYPDMADVQFKRMVRSMEKGGYSPTAGPIVHWRGQIVDGWHRARAASEAGLDVVPVYELAYDATEEKVWSVARVEQNSRRNLSKVQQVAFLFVECIQRKGRVMANEEMAETTGCSLDYVNKVSSFCRPPGRFPYALRDKERSKKIALKLARGETTLYQLQQDRAGRNVAVGPEDDVLDPEVLKRKKRDEEASKYSKYTRQRASDNIRGVLDEDVRAGSPERKWLEWAERSLEFIDDGNWSFEGGPDGCGEWTGRGNPPWTKEGQPAWTGYRHLGRWQDAYKARTGKDYILDPSVDVLNVTEDPEVVAERERAAKLEAQLEAQRRENERLRSGGVAEDLVAPHKQQIRQLTEELDERDVREQQAFDESLDLKESLRRANLRVSDLEAKVDGLEKDIADLEKDLAARDARIAELEQAQA